MGILVATFGWPSYRRVPRDKPVGTRRKYVRVGSTAAVQAADGPDRLTPGHLASVLRRLIASTRMPAKPAWARVPDRAWRRHGALIACLHEQRQARGP